MTRSALRRLRTRMRAALRPAISAPYLKLVLTVVRRAILRFAVVLTHSRCAPSTASDSL